MERHMLNKKPSKDSFQNAFKKITRQMIQPFDASYTFLDAWNIYAML